MSEVLFGPEPAAPPPAPVYTERAMLDALRARHSATRPGHGPRYVFAEHVRNQAGFGGDHWGTGRLRTADAMAIDLWPSTGNEIHGFEVKVSRSDWLTELKDPEKAEAFRPYVHRWWLAVSDARIVRDDLPTGWGLLVLSPDGRLRQRVAAPRLNPEPMSPSMMAALLRAAVKTATRCA